ncbi:FAA hydrolase family protein [Salmonella enterica]|uniref:Fumarylacetoacetate hydrolase family protein n=1 Tax=Salmonella enterica I TaxID=59201 RepID=A0A615QTB0_SALET|nr:fumarylacetoacetate hydrolase family protein [Salmonella enterica]EBS4906784.1 FAA hydrolase family protein [Salmonella enterica subsp. enterica serovar Kingabwa]EAV0188800.1 FAA hydrolase family protein [Salmonella enterica]EAZ9004751.1 fumarylacetoacetate hydrolase family protein [Salmonella enterica]EBG8413326.1 fumarylacetoacetate hydrolase family protein [Salmonella enterica]
MKLVQYLVNGGKRYGIMQETGIIDLSQRLGDKYPTLKSLLCANALTDAALWCDEPADYYYQEVTFLPVIDAPQKIICVGMNYADKRIEFNETNPAPTLFVRFADSQTGHNGLLLKPENTNEFDYEGELAVVIGRPCSRVSAEDALDYVAGYSCYMDGSVRDWQHSWFTAGKNWPSTGSFGPCLVTTDDIPDPQMLRLLTRLNGREVQNESTANMIHPIASLIAYISTFTLLSPGDTILTGSPGRVGKKRVPPLFLHDGDVIEVEIEHIGTLRNVVRDSRYLTSSVSWHDGRK